MADARAPPSPRERSVDHESAYDDTFKDLDELKSIEDNRFEAYAEGEEDWDAILGISEGDTAARQTGSIASSGFDDELGKIYEDASNGAADGENPFALADNPGSYADEDEVDDLHNGFLDDAGQNQYSQSQRRHARNGDSVATEGHTHGEYLIGEDIENDEDERLAGTAFSPKQDETLNTQAGNSRRSKVDLESEMSGYDAENSFQTTADEDFEEDEEPPPPPSSPPPTEDDLEGNETTTDDDGTTERSSKANSLTQQELFEDVIYRAGNDRDGYPVVVFLPGDVKKVLEANSMQLSDDESLSREEVKLLNYCVEFLGDIAAKSPFVLVIAPAGETANILQARRAIGKLVTVLKSFPRHPHRKSLRKLVILHPDPVISSILLAFKPFVSSKFWRKLVYVRRVADLDSILQPSSTGEEVSLPLPEDVLFFDITGAVGMDAGARGRGSTTQGRQARVRAESEVPNPPSAFTGHWTVASSLGMPLAVVAAKTPFNLPALVIRCVTFLCMHGVKTPGLFRISGNADTVAYVKQNLASSKDVDLGGYWSPSGRAATVEDVHVCAGLLKTFVRELPKPILTHAAYTSILLASERTQDQDELADKIGDVCQLLPRPNRNLLQYLSYFMQYVLKNEPFNQMTAQNLAIVWVPNLFRDETDVNDPERELRTLPHAMRAALVMFTHPQRVFPLETSTLLPVCYAPDTGLPLPVEDVCTHDATGPTPDEPLSLDEREFDGISQRKELTSTASFSLRAAVSSSDMDQGFETGTLPRLGPSRSFSVGDAGLGGEPRTLSEIHALSVKDLKRFLVINGYDPSSCVEKSDLRRMAVECLKAQRIREGRSIEDLDEIPVAIARPPSGSASSFDRLRRRRSSEGLISGDESSGSKRGSDLGRPDRRESDVAFLAVLRQAGLTMDDAMSNVSLNDDNSSISTTKESSPLVPGVSAAQTSSQERGQKRDFSQVGTASAASAPLAPAASGKLGMLSLLRRKSLLTRDNKRDLAKSAKAIGNGKSAKSSNSSSAAVPISSPDSDDSSGAGFRAPAGRLMRAAGRQTSAHLKRGSSSDESPRPPSLEETLRALKETPLFGEDDALIGNGTPGRRHSLVLGPSAIQSRATGSNGSTGSAPKPKGNNGAFNKGGEKWRVSDVDSMGVFDLKTLLKSQGKRFQEDAPVEELRDMARRVIFAATVGPVSHAAT